MDLVEWLLQGHSVEIAAQFQHDGENDLHGPLGARLIIAGKVEQLLSWSAYDEAEIRVLRAAHAAVQTKITQWSN